ncbi:MAG TPA: glycosyltransferase family 2 protein [Chthonomonadales bacterium]|nr:glycosyltransferase family 2 protein [Chthonomonadales bacterium]
MGNGPGGSSSGTRSDPAHLSVVIVTWNTRDYLLAALRSIRESAVDFRVETIVVDNASGDGTAEAVASEHPEALLIANADNAGYARGNNQGIAAAAGRMVLLLNPDVVLPPTALASAVDALERRPDVGALGVRLTSPDGSLQRSVRGFPTPFSVFCEAIGLSRLFPRNRRLASYRMGWFAYDRECEVDQPMGTFLLIRREALEDVGMLDERFPIFFNEVDWCFRARSKGWRILFSPVADVLHHGGAATRQIWAEMAWESRRGLLAYYRKHYRAWWFAPIYWVAAGASWVQACRSAKRRGLEVGRT